MIFNIILLIFIAILMLIALYMDVKRNNIIEDWVSILGGIIVLIFIGFGLIDRQILSFNIFNLNLINLTLFTSLISGVLSFVLYYFIPFGGGDMKILTFLSLFFGFWETFFILGEACIISLIYILVWDFLIKKRKLSLNNEFPLMIGISIATILNIIFIIL